MTRYIQDGNLRVVYAPTIADTAAPTETELTAGEDITGFIMSLSTPDEGNPVADVDPTTTWDGTIEGTRSGNITGMFSRDKATDADTAWDTLPYGTAGYFVIRRFGDGAMAADDIVDVWPIRVSGRSPIDYGRNTKDAFNSTIAVPNPGPVYDSVVASGV